MQNPFQEINERLERIEFMLYARQPETDDTGGELLPVSKVCKLLSIRAETLINYQKRGLIKCVYIGRRKFVPKSELDRIAKQA